MQKRYLKKLKPLKALIVRLVFTAHIFVSVYRVVAAYGNPLFWLLLLSLVALWIETGVTLARRGGKEWTWFSPAIFCYLAAAVPPIWLLEIQLSDIRVRSLTGNTATNTSADFLSNEIGVNVPLDLSGWALAMEQALLFILILGRWFMPKGNISKSQLSQILLVYIGMAADIMELFEVFKEEQVAFSLHLTYPTLSLWTLALLQYTLVISSTKAKKSRYGDLEEAEEGHLQDTGDCCQRQCGLDAVNIDVLGIMSTIIMQDGPFLCFRLYLLAGLGIISQMMVFFTCKNLLVILVQIYRLITIYCETDYDDLDEDSSGGQRKQNEGSLGRRVSSSFSSTTRQCYEPPVFEVTAADGKNNNGKGPKRTFSKSSNRVTPTPDEPSSQRNWAPEIAETQLTERNSTDDISSSHPHSVNSSRNIS